MLRTRELQDAMGQLDLEEQLVFREPQDKPVRRERQERLDLQDPPAFEAKPVQLVLPV